MSISSLDSTKEPHRNIMREPSHTEDATMSARERVLALPQLLKEILSYLDPFDVQEAKAVCKLWHSPSSSPKTTQHLNHHQRYEHA